MRISLAKTSSPASRKEETPTVSANLDSGKDVVERYASIVVTSTQTMRHHWTDMPWKKSLLLLIVVLPTLLAAFYFTFIAADQYVTEFRFNLRGASNPASQGAISGAMSMGGSSINPAVLWDSYAVVEYIKSREIVDELQKKIDLRKIYANPAADFLTRLDPKKPDERVTEYWQNMVDPYFDMNTGVISVHVRAFTPHDSQLVAQTVLAQSETLINNLTERARSDALTYFSDEVTRAEAALRETDAALSDIRNTYGILDPNRTATLSDNVRSHQEESLSSLREQYQSVLHSVGPTSPLLPVLKSQMAAAATELRIEDNKTTQSKVTTQSPDVPVLSSILSKYDALLREQYLREKSLNNAQESLQQARMDSNRQQLYLNAFVHPALPELSTYPHRVRSVMIVFAFTLLIWGLVTLGVHAVHDHL